MKKLLLFSIFLLSQILYSQIDSTILKTKFVVKIDSNVIAGRFVNEKCLITNKEKLESPFFIKNHYVLEDYILCNNEGTAYFYFKIFDGEKSLIVPLNSVIYLEKNDNSDVASLFFSKLNSDQKNLYSNELRDYVLRSKKEIERSKKIQVLDAENPILEEGFKVMEQPISIVDFSFPGEYSIGFKVTVRNNTNNKIKYIYFTVAGFNAVDDRVYTYSGKATSSRKGVGPLAKEEIASWDFESIWPSNTFNYGRIVSITVEYFNGTKKTFSKPGALVMPEGFSEAVEKLNQLLEEEKIN